jgi:tetratricopeptide (TPR) repeat protein
LLESTPTLRIAFRQALEAFQDGRFEDAQQLCNAVLAIKSDFFEALYLLALVQARLGSDAGALLTYDKALSIRPREAEVWHDRGVALNALGRLDEALASYDAALAIKPGHVGALVRRGLVLTGRNCFAEAIWSFDRALNIAGDDAAALNGRGIVLNRIDRFADALKDFDLALALRPDDPDALNNRGNALAGLNRFDEAIASYDRALAIRPDDATALSNRGNALVELKDFDAALASFRHAQRLRPDYGDAHYNEAGCRLLIGDYEEGWRKYEWRSKTRHGERTMRKLARPLWLGKEDLAGRTILVHADSGFGDTLQFCRYVRSLAARGAHVIFEVQPALKRLMAEGTGARLVVARGEPLPDFDLHCPLLSLPLAFATSVTTIPPPPPPLPVPAQPARDWEARLPPRKPPSGQQLRVGICWSGNPLQGDDKNRSMTLDAMGPLFELPIQLVSLQKEVRPHDRAFLVAHGARFPHFGADLSDFLETAALASRMDLVVSVDTSVAHLACALGLRTWIPLAFRPDWRWLADGDRCPWYPQARLFRQSRRGDWAEVIARVAAAIRELAAPA